jgi:predicted nucleotidyltransferase
MTSSPSKLNALELIKLLKRDAAEHKGNAGKVLLIGGAPGMAGALLLAGNACLHLGSGWTILEIGDVGRASPSMSDGRFETCDNLDMTVGHIEFPARAIADVCRRDGIRKLALFGSVLTDRFTDDSDIDVLVEFLPGQRVGFFRLADIQSELSALMGGRKVDLQTPMSLSRYFRDEVARTAIVLYAQA